jgi:hypothetical protein
LQRQNEPLSNKETEFWREWVLHNLAVALAQLGEFFKSEQIIDRIELADFRAASLRALAVALVQVELRDRANQAFSEYEKAVPGLRLTIERTWLTTTAPLRLPRQGKSWRWNVSQAGFSQMIQEQWHCTLSLLHL